MSIINSSEQDEESEEFVKLCKCLATASTWEKTSKYLKTIKTPPESLRWSILAWISGCLINGSQYNDEQLNDVIGFFEKSFEHSGKAGLISACFDCSS